MGSLHEQRQRTPPSTRANRPGHCRRQFVFWWPSDDGRHGAPTGRPGGAYLGQQNILGQNLDVGLEDTHIPHPEPRLRAREVRILRAPENFVLSSATCRAVPARGGRVRHHATNQAADVHRDLGGRDREPITDGGNEIRHHDAT